jgi:hypothetical protein
MLKKLLVAAGAPFALAVALGTAVPAWADAPGGKGNTSVEDANGDKSTGAPTNANGFGTVSSQLATAVGGLGDHTSFFAPGQRKDDGEPATGRLGVGNVASNDGNLISDTNPGPDTGTRPGDHASLIDGIQPEGFPATNALGHPGRQCTTCR